MITFRPAIRESVGLIIGLAGGTGSGKTYTAMRLATGISGEQRFAVVDTEAGRAKHYADEFKFDHADLTAPFRPDAYVEAIEAADKAGYPVIIVDSVSHEWNGTGGILDWQEDEYQRLGAKESIKLLSWSKPKQSHKKMVSRLLQSRAHLILCFRAEPHVEMVKGDDGKMKITPRVGQTGLDGWFPITEKNLPFELTVSFLLKADRPGVPLPIKLPERLRPLFPLDKPITEESGRAIAEWAAGGKRPTAPPPQSDDPHINAMQAADLESACSEIGASVQSLKKAAGVSALTDIKVADLPRALQWIAAAKAKREAATP